MLSLLFKRMFRVLLPGITSCLSDRRVENIAFMRLFRESKGHTAYTIVESDGKLPEEIADTIRQNEHVLDVMVVQM